MRVNVDIPNDDIIDALSEENDHEKLLDIIKNLDLRVGDWAFTKNIAVHFVQEMKKGLDECGLYDESYIKEAENNLSKSIKYMEELFK